MSEREKIDALAGTLLSSTACFASLIMTLTRKGILSAADERELYETALQLLETNQGDDPATNLIYEMAREVIEEQLRAD